MELLVPGATADVRGGSRAGRSVEPARFVGPGTRLARRKDGSQFPAQLALSMIELEGARRFFAAVRDGSDRVRAADAQARLAAIVESSHDAIVGMTRDGVITSWNPSAERLYGYPAQEIVGQRLELLLPPAARERERQIIETIGRGERVAAYQTVRVRRDGSEIEVALTVSPIQAADGTVVGIASTARDLSDRQRADARFRGLLEAAPDAMLCVDPGGNITLVNAQAERLFGYPRDELIGHPVEVLVPDAARGVHPRRRTAYLAAPVPRPMGAGTQLAGRRKDGSEFPAEISLSAIELDDRLLVSAAVRDVSERLEAQAERDRLQLAADRDRMERQLQQSQRLESLGQLDPAHASAPRVRTP